jgi:hypothetical protein
MASKAVFKFAADRSAAYYFWTKITWQLMSKELLSSDPPPPKQSLYWQSALLWQSLAFLIVIVLTWSDALFDLCHFVLGMPHQARDLNRAAITTVVIIMLWMLSAYKIYRVVSRLTYLESFLHVCAWCRKIEHHNQWLSMEAHFTEKTGHKPSHGICPECSAKLLGPVLAKE